MTHIVVTAWRRRIPMPESARPTCLNCAAPAAAVDPRVDAADERGPMAYCDDCAPPTATPLPQWTLEYTHGW